MNYHRLSLRLLGLCLAFLILAVGVQLLLISFEVEPLVSRSRLARFDEWVRRRPRSGPGLLAGTAMAVSAAWLVWAFYRSFGPDRRMIVTRQQDGYTRVDMASLEAAIERHAETLDLRGSVRVKLDRSGRVDATLTTSDPSASGPSQELRDSIDEFCLVRSIPCRSGRITVGPARRSRRRRV